MANESKKDAFQRDNINELGDGKDPSPRWKVIRERRELLILVCAKCPAVVIPTLMILGSVFRRWTSIIGVMIAISIVVCGFAFCILYLRYIFSRCPRCGKPFFINFIRNNPYAENCLHCGLVIWATDRDINKSENNGT